MIPHTVPLFHVQGVPDSNFGTKIGNPNSFVVFLRQKAVAMSTSNYDTSFQINYSSFFLSSDGSQA
jgi:hypothetical protein